MQYDNLKGWQKISTFALELFIQLQIALKKWLYILSFEYACELHVRYNKAQFNKHCRRHLSYSQSLYW